MKKKLISVLLTASMCMALAVGCGSQSSDEGEASEEGKSEKITFMVPDWGVPTDEQLAAFTEETGIEVEISRSRLGMIFAKSSEQLPAANECVADVVEVVLVLGR